MDGITSLKEAIRTVPIPGSPPPGSREGAAVGLAFLDMALRQNHIRRLTERLTLVEHRAATRTTEVDIRLSLLDNNQRESSRLFEELTSRSPAIESNKDEDGTGRSSIWVPVTRISRRSVAPIDVVDSSGVKLPRLIQYETSSCSRRASTGSSAGSCPASPSLGATRSWDGSCTGWTSRAGWCTRP